MSKRLKILISAYACEPDKGSEPGVGWRLVKHISPYHELWVLTRRNNKNSIEQALAREPLPNVRWVYFDLPKFLCFWKSGQRGVQLYYYFWQIGAYFIAKKLHNKIKFNLTHHITFGSMRYPSTISFLPVPFIWGPLGGGEIIPKRLWRYFTLSGKIYQYVRALNFCFLKIDPLLIGTIKRSSLSIARTEATVRLIRQLGGKNIIMFGETALTEEEIGYFSDLPVPRNSTLRFISISRLVHIKGISLAIRAFADAGIKGSEYWVVGEGPECDLLKRLSEKLNISSQIKFLGKLSHNETLRILSESSVFIHPSLRDAGSWVLVEAMAAGIPVICLDMGDQALEVSEEAGIRIKTESLEQIVKDLSKAMIRLSGDSNLRERMGQAGKKRVLEQYTWSKKTKEFLKIYEDIAGA